MDDLDRIFRRLVQQLRARYPQYLSRPFDVEEIYQVIVPYRHHRQELGIDTNQDYEVAVMRLLSGERDFLAVDREMRESLSRELESANPDTSLFRVYANHRVSVSAEMLGGLDETTPTRGDDARLSVAAADARRPRPGRNEDFDAPAAARGRNGTSGVSTTTGSASSTSSSGSSPRFDGIMPLPPPPAVQRNTRGGIEGAIPPTPPRGVPRDRLMASSAPTTMPPAGRSTGITGHGGRTGGGLGTPPAFVDRENTDGGARGSESVPSRKENSDSGAAAAAASSRGTITQSPDAPMVTPRRSVAAEAIGGSCRYCTSALPEGRQITYCPHCGQDLTVQQCQACSTELELGWKFCTTCGRSVGQS